MRSVLVAMSVMALALAPEARADDAADVGALVVKLVRATASDKGAPAALFAKDPVVATGDGAASDPPRYQMLFGADAGEARLEPGKPTVVVANHVAWFHVVVQASYVQELMNADGPNRKRDHAEVRVSGIAIDDHGWKIAAVMLANVASDQWLRSRPAYERRPASIADQPDTPAGAVARWLYDGTLAAHAANGTRIANGSAPGELGSGTAASKLAKGWDTLKLWGVSLAAKQVGALAFVHGDVYLPMKEGAAHLALAAILVKSGETWTWTCLNFAPGEP